MKQVVYAYVCGDIFHKGHLLALKNARRMGDVLIVGVLTDEVIRRMKQKNPVRPFDERIELVRSLRCVDLAVPQIEYSPYSNLQRIRPQILMESASHSVSLLAEVKSAMSEWGGRVFVMPYYPGCSSTQIKETIREAN